MKDVADSLPPVFESISISWNDNNSLNWKCDDNPATHSGNEKPEKLSSIPGFKVNNLILRSDRSCTKSKLGDVLKVSLNSKNVDISVGTIHEAVQLLSIVKPEFLESIRLWPFEKMRKFSRIFQTEQFKKAKNAEIFSLKGFKNTKIISHFSHLKSFKIKLSGSFQEKDFLKIREMISTFEAFEKCELRIVDDGNEFLIRDICEAFGEKFPEGPLKTITHRYQCPKSKKCLEFKIEGGGPRISMKINKIC
ncbi:unnamed protein product [Caenorhabditis nigoni]